jgi:putative oxidoreductase
VDFLDHLRPFTLLVLRCMLALLFLYYGYPKLAHGISGPEQYMVSVGLPSYFAYISVALEVGGGALLALGLFTRPVALLLAIEMGVAMWKVDMTHGIRAVPDYQFALALGASALALASFGAGSISLDHAFFGRSSKPRPKPKA